MVSFLPHASQKYESLGHLVTPDDYLHCTVPAIVKGAGLAVCIYLHTSLYLLMKTPAHPFSKMHYFAHMQIEQLCEYVAPE